MKIRLKLILLFASINVIILTSFATFIYVSSSADREEEFYKNLRRQALTKANLLLDAKVASFTLQTIYQNARDILHEEEVAVYDSAFNLLYHDAVDIDLVKETPEMIKEILKNKELRFKQGDAQVTGFLVAKDGKKFVITAAANDHYGRIELGHLRNTIGLSLLVSMVIILASGHFFAGKVLEPVSEMVSQAKNITANNLDSRLNEGTGKDEISELAMTFNQMLNRLEKSFDMQKQFVSNMSHELRTPLATIAAEIELSQLKERSNEEYKNAINSVSENVQRIIKLSNSLLDLAKASYDKSEIGMKATRLDELLLDARELIIKSNLDYKVNIIFEKEIENDEFISINGNKYLLNVAILNLIENGCKFSNDKSCTVTISYLDARTILKFSNTGSGINDVDLPHIFKPFYRGQSSSLVDGNGIGLSLTEKIVQLHHGSITVTSRINEGATFTVNFPHR